MRRRVKRELAIIVGIVVVLGVLVFANAQVRREDLKERMIKVRQFAEETREVLGMELLKWDLLQKTTGVLRTGPTFHEKLLPYDQTVVTLIGFMVPIYEYRDVTEFLLLPMPLECYFCQRPPMRDVVLVQMREGKRAEVVNEPIMVGGIFQLNQGPGTKFFYAIREADWTAGRAGATLTRKMTPLEHQRARPVEEELLEGTEPPTAAPRPEAAS